MRWKPDDALRHTRKANSPAKRRQWADVANSELAAGRSEGRAVRAANTVVKNRPSSKRK